MKKIFKKIAITGATGGIGSAIAKALDQRGYALLVSGRNEKKLDQLLASLEGDHHLKVVADLTTQKGVDALKNLADDFAIDGLVNCLGTNRLAMLKETKDEELLAMTNTNLLAPIRVCKALLPQLQRHSDAVIVNVGSILGSIGYAGSSVYCATKYGLRGFTESLRRELADENISVIYLAPRATNTALNTDAMNEMNRALGNAIDSPESVAEQLIRSLELGKPANRYMGWPERFFVKLNGLFPSIVDKALSKQLATINHYCEMNQI